MSIRRMPPDSRDALCRRVAGFAATMPADGMAQGAFEAAALLGVPIEDHREAVMYLARKGVVWRSEIAGEARLYASKPAKLPRSPQTRRGYLAGVLAALAPYALTLGRSAVEGSADKSPIEARRFAVAVRKQVEQGLSLTDV